MCSFCNVAGSQAVQELQLQSLISQKHWDTFARFLCRIESAYRNVPYHNSTHAADVTARISALLLRSGIWEEDMGECGKMSMLATILAAVVHDVGHPGECLLINAMAHSC
jgi:metal-dependent HD superfamily phosphatase/phosphodiesterase